MIRQKLPNRPKARDQINAKWGRDVVDYLRASTPISDGKSTAISRFPGGSIIGATKERQTIAKITGGGTSGLYDATEQVWDASGGVFVDADEGKVWSSSGSGDFPQLQEINMAENVADDSYVLVYSRFHDEGELVWVFDATSSASDGLIHFSAALFNDGADKIKVQPGSVFSYFGTATIPETDIVAVDGDVYIEISLITDINATVSAALILGTYPGYINESASKIYYKLGTITTISAAFVWTAAHDGDIHIGSGRHEFITLRNAADDGTSDIFFLDGHFMRTSESGFGTPVGGLEAAHFNGTNEYLSLVDNADISTGDIDFTIEIWVRLDTILSDQGIVGKWGGSLKEYLIEYDATADRFKFHIGDGTTGISASVSANSIGNPAVNTWYQIIAWHDATADEISIQVSLSNATTTAYAGGATDTAAALNVGRNEADSEYFDGQASNFRLWKKILSASDKSTLWNDGCTRNHANITAALDVADLKVSCNLDESSTGVAPVTRIDSKNSNDLTDNNNTPSINAVICGPLPTSDAFVDATAYYKMEEAAGNDRVDSIGSNDLTEVGGTVPNIGTGINNNAVAFDASRTSPYLELDGAGADYKVTNGKLSWSGWVRWDAELGNGHTLNLFRVYYSAGPDEVAVYIERVKPGGASVGRVTVTQVSTTNVVLEMTGGTDPVSIATWVHVGVVVDGSEIIYYRNGAALKCIAYDGTIYSDATNLRVHCGGSEGSTGINGDMDEVAWWNGIAKSPADMLDIYNGGTGKFL